MISSLPAASNATAGSITRVASSLAGASALELAGLFRDSRAFRNPRGEPAGSVCRKMKEDRYGERHRGDGEGSSREDWRRHDGLQECPRRERRGKRNVV